jgi:hypothetical protein
MPDESTTPGLVELACACARVDGPGANLTPALLDLLASERAPSLGQTGALA